jgi:hypothetical protein
MQIAISKQGMLYTRIIHSFTIMTRCVSLYTVNRIQIFEMRVGDVFCFVSHYQESCFRHNLGSFRGRGV